MASMELRAIVSTAIGRLGYNMLKPEQEAAKGLSVGCITRESSDSERAMVLSGQYQLVLFSPEALLIVRRWREMLQSEVYKSRIIAFVIDKAHYVNSHKIHCEL